MQMIWKAAALYGVLSAGQAWGATPANEKQPKDRFRPDQRRYWAFQPVKPVAPPAVAASAWVRNPIDAFVLAKLEEKSLTPGRPVDKTTLLRRAYFDLIGVPPTVAEVETFLADTSPQAFEKVVDRLLASPKYGERWARHWLDLARFAESDGFRADDVRPNAWRYRDYVIRAFNSDKPYDRFVQEQLAGDEMWPDDLDAHVATAFNRHYPDEYNAQNLRMRRQQILDDMTDTTGAVFMGLTFECARCHDHKFDPILHSDYYRLQSFFSNVSADDEFPMLPKAEYAEYQRKLGVWQRKTADIRARMQEILKAAREKSRKARYMAYVDEVQVALDKPLSERSPIELWMADKAKYFMNATDESLAAGLKGEAKDKWQKLKAELDKFKDLHPGELPKGTVLTELTTTPIPTHVLSSGAYNRPTDEVQPGFLQILDPGVAKLEPVPSGTTGRRTALAKWLTSPQNPLTARVMANRIWHYHFGRGILPTPSDFGRMGERRSHPELLDWLSAEFVKNGWSLKQMHRLIMTSNTYRQSSDYRADAAQKDPEDRLLWRYHRHRLESEALRDTALSVAGVLNPAMYGPSVRPPLPKGVPDGAWKTSPDEADQRRRSIYTFIRRNNLYPMLDVFDMPDTHLTCGRRGETTTAPQALTYLNNEQTLAWASKLAGRVLQQAGADPAQQVDLVYRIAYSRPPTGTEKDTALTFFRQHQPIIAERVQAGGKVMEPETAGIGVSAVDAAVLVDFCHAIFNSSEFVYIN
jgi:hypothetical protein